MTDQQAGGNLLVDLNPEQLLPLQTLDITGLVAANHSSVKLPMGQSELSKVVMRQSDCRHFAEIPMRANQIIGIFAVANQSRDSISLSGHI